MKCISDCSKGDIFFRPDTESFVASASNQRSIVDTSGRLAVCDYDDAVGVEPGGYPQQGGALALRHVYTRHNDNIVSFVWNEGVFTGNESVEIRRDKSRPVTSTGNCRALLSQVDAFRRFVDSDY